MALETASFVADLVATNPITSDPVAQGDDHLRLLKTVLQTTFPNVGNRYGRVIAGNVGYTVLSSDNTALIDVPAAIGATITHTFSLPALASITAGFYLDFVSTGQTDVSYFVPTGGASIEGAASLLIGPLAGARVYYDGTTWRAAKFPLAIAGTAGMQLGALTLSSTLTVSGAAHFGSTMSVSGATVLGSTLSVSGAAHFRSTLSVAGAASMGSTLSVGSTTIGGTLTVSAATVLGTTLNVLGAATLASTLSVSGAAVFTSGISAIGASGFAGSVSISGATHLNTTLSVGGAVTLGSTLTVASATVLGTTLNVLGAATLASTLSVSGAAHFNTTLSVGGATTLAGTLSVSAAAVLLSTLVVAGTTRLSSTLSVSGAAHFNTTLSVGGASTLAGVLVNGAATLAGTLSVSAATTLLSTLVVAGTTRLANTLSVSGAAHFNTTLSVGGATTLGSTVTISGTCVLSSGQLAFPAVQNASASANILDDYEEGTWTPTLTFSTPGDLSVVYTTRGGFYTKIGRQVDVIFDIVTSTFTYTTGSGEAWVTGLPFTSSDGSPQSTLGFAGITSAGYTQFTLQINATDNKFVGRQSGSGQVFAQFGSTEMPSGTNQRLNGNCTHFT